MQIIEPKHDLPNNVDRLSLGETLELLKPFEELAPFDDLGDDVIIVLVFQQIHNANDLGMAFAAQDAQLVFEQRQKDFSFSNHFFLHNFYCEFVPGVIQFALAHFAKSALAEVVPQGVLLLNVFNVFKFFVLVHSKRPRLDLRLQVLYLRRLLSGCLRCESVGGFLVALFVFFKGVVVLISRFLFSLSKQLHEFIFLLDSVERCVLQGVFATIQV